MPAFKKGVEIAKEEAEKARKAAEADRIAKEDAEALATKDAGKHDPETATIGGGKRKMSRRKKNKKRSCTKKNRRNRNK